MPSYWQCSGYFVEWQEWRLSHCRDDSICLLEVRGVKEPLSRKSKFAQPPHRAPSPLSTALGSGAKEQGGVTVLFRLFSVTPNLARLRSEYWLVPTESRYKSVLNVAAPLSAVTVEDCVE
jgi:hypothetical protein